MLKALFIVLMLIQSFASSASVIGRGEARAFCHDYNSFSCMSDLKRRAEYDAERAINAQCRAQQQVATGIRCNTFCNPNFIPPNSGSRLVHCRSTCQGVCR